MSQENVDLITEAYAAFNDAYRTGDFRPVIERYFHPDVVFRPAGILPENDEVRGREELLGFTARQAEAFEELSITPEEIIDAGERVVIPLRLGGTARFTGIPIEFSMVHVATLRDGRAVRVEVFAHRAEAMRAAGLA